MSDLRLTGWLDTQIGGVRKVKVAQAKRPNLIVVGEVRGSEAFVQLCARGQVRHRGSSVTVSARHKCRSGLLGNRGDMARELGDVVALPARGHRHGLEGLLTAARHYDY